MGEIFSQLPPQSYRRFSTVAWILSKHYESGGTYFAITQNSTTHSDFVSTFNHFWANEKTSFKKLLTARI